MAQGNDGLIDDLEDGDNAIAPAENRAGYWFSHNDESSSCTQTPAAGSEFVPTAGGEPNSPEFAACTSGRNCHDWGAGIGLEFEDDPSNGGVCSPGYDASVYSGISFCYQSSGLIRLIVAMATTASTGEEHGVDLAASASWSCESYAWSAMDQPSWVTNPQPLDPGTITQIRFEANQDNQPFDFCVDSLAFY